jgi:hypothetical protein
MRRTITLSLVTSFYIFSLVSSANAIFCSNCSTIFEQIPQYATEVVTTGASSLTAANTSYLLLKNSVLDPLGNALIAASLLSQQKGTLNLVTGSQGSQPLLKSDPQKWIASQGLNSVRVNISDVSNSKGVYSASIANSLSGTYKNSNNLTAQLQGLTQSSIPSITQNDLCKDANLTAIAKNDVMKRDGTFNPADLTRRKTEIYNSLCKGNPQTDPVLAKKLQQVNSQRPDIAGWDTFLAVTSGDNAYAKTVQAQIKVAEDKEKKETAARDDLNRGGGVASPSKCTQTASSPNLLGITNIANLPCKTSQLTGSGSAVNSRYQNALNIDFQNLAGKQGFDIVSSLAQLLSAKNTIDLMANAFGGGSSSSGTRTTTNNTSTTATSSAARQQDLADSPATKASLIQPITDRLATYSSSLTKLQTADNSLQAQISIAQGNLATMRACFQGVADDFELNRNDARIASAFDYYQNKMSYLSNLSATVTSDQSQIQSANTTITTLKNLLASSNSTQEISDAYNAFEGKVRSGTLPNDSSGSLREGDAIKLQGENQVANLEGGDLYNLNGQCQSARQQLQSGRGF